MNPIVPADFAEMRTALEAERRAKLNHEPHPGVTLSPQVVLAIIDRIEAIERHLGIAP